MNKQQGASLQFHVKYVRRTPGAMNRLVLVVKKHLKL